MIENKYIGTSEAAEILDVSTSTVRRLADDNKIKCFINPNNKYRNFDKKEVLNFKKKMERPELGQLQLFNNTLKEDESLYNIKAKSHPAHYLMHKYWGRKPYNVISSYIINFTEPGDTVLDPFMGSAMVPIESIKNGRFGVGIDINPMSKFIGNNTVSKVNLTHYETVAYNILSKLKDTFPGIYETKCPDCDESGIIENAIWENGEIVRIKSECSTHGKYVKDADTFDKEKYSDISDLKINLLENNNISYPKDEIFKYVQRSGVTTLDDIFNNRALILISKLKEFINEIDNDEIKSLLNMTFTSMLPNVSKMLPGDKERGTYKSGWVISKFWVPKIHTERNVLNCFSLRVKAIIRGKEELQFVNNDYLTLKTHDSANLDFIESESIDYIFTDPPYGESIAYLALSQMWNAWLKNDVNYDNEIIIDSYRDKDYLDYFTRMKKVFTELYRVLKNKSYLSFTFNNRDLNVWKAVMDAVKESGFKLEFIIYQGQAVTSGTQGINKKNTLTGDFVYTLYKDKNEESITKQNKDIDDNVEFIKSNIEKIIQQNSSITPTRLYEFLIPIIVENDSYHDKNGKGIDIEKILEDNYKYIEITDNNTRLGENFQWRKE